MDNAVFLEKLVELFPDTQECGSITRKQIAITMETLNTTKWPTFILKNAVSRGVYAFPGASVQPTENTTPVKKSKTPQVGSVAEDPIAVSNAIEESALVPKSDSTFVSFGNYKDVETIINSRQFYPTYIAGPTGNGKSTMVTQACAKLKRGLIRVNMNMSTDEDALIGTKTLQDGNIEIVEGPVLIAMRLGIPLLLDEIDAGGANALMCLQPILEGKPYYFKLKNEIVHPAPGFNIFATANTKGKGSDDGRYIGTNVLNEAFLERFSVTLNQEYPNQSTELRILTKLMESLNVENEQFAQNLVKWAHNIRKTFDDGGIDETITTRRLIHIVRAYAIFKDEEKAIKLCTNRFDSAVQSAVVTLYESVSKPAETATPAQPAMSGTNPVDTLIDF